MHKAARGNIDVADISTPNTSNILGVWDTADTANPADRMGSVMDLATQSLQKVEIGYRNAENKPNEFAWINA
jgi:hypothetical protein